MGNHYKDSLFRSLFDNEAALLELYNSIKGTRYDENTELIINTLTETVFSHQKNDVSFTIDGKLVVMVEQQSTINENMPFRFLLYVARVLENYIAKKKVVYGRKLVKLPRPEFWQSLTQEEMNMLSTEWNMEDALEVRFEEGVETVAENALRKGATVEFVHEISGLSLERIQELWSATTTSTRGV